MTSLKEQQKAHDTIAGRLILEWKTPQNSQKVLLIVEGPSDVNFYGTFFKTSTCGIRSGGSCSSLNKIHAEILEKGTNIKKHIIIRDSDFSRVNGCHPQDKCIFYADTHDHEMMCVSDSDVLARVVSKEGLSETDTLFRNITEELRMLSYFKWYNYTYNKKISFKHIDLVSISNENLMDIEKLYVTVTGRCSNTELPAFLKEFTVFFASRNEVNMAEITNGHDFIKRFIAHLKRKVRKQVSEEKIRESLHREYGIYEFSKSNLYLNLAKWEKDNERKILRTS